MTYQIRKTKQGDINELASVYMRAYACEPWNEPDWQFEQAYARIDELFSSSNSICFTYEENDIIKGAILCKLLSWYDGKKIEWHELFVDAKYQRQGIGTKLVQHLESTAPALGVNEINFWTMRTEEATQLISFYKNLGYVIAEDRIVMVKEIDI